MSNSEDLLFDDEGSVQTTDREAPETGLPRDTWKVLVVDDEEEVHSITKLALGDFSFEGMSLAFLHAHSGKEAREMLNQHTDVALILLDVVMETEDAGLQVVKYIRETLKNSMVRIVLRTGQPGQAPERKVIMDYDINDYKTKTELTAQKLFTTMVSSLRAFRDLKIIEANRRGLEKIIDASSSIFELQSLEKFIEGALTQIISLLYLEQNSAYITSFAACERDGDLFILRGTGSYAALSMKPLHGAVSDEVKALLQSAMSSGESIYENDRCAIYFKTKNGTHNMVFMQGTRNLTAWDKNLLEIFCGNIGVALDNIYLIDRIVQKERESERHRLETERACEALSRYVSPQIAADILLQDVSFTGQRTRATMLFFDIRDFTAYSETMHAEEVVALLNSIFEEIVGIIFEHTGTLDKFLGDGLMAVFGVPLSTGADEINAVTAAIKIREAMSRINEARVREKLPAIQFGIGIHTGDVVAGNVGSRKRVDYTVIGKSVNLASRVEALTKHFSTDILITHDTFERVEDSVDCRQLDPVAVKGIQNPITTYYVEGLRAVEA